MLIKGAVFTIILVIWNGRRVVNAVIVPIWARIRHYADLNSAIQYALVPVVAALAAWFTPTGRPQQDTNISDNNNTGLSQ